MFSWSDIAVCESIILRNVGVPSYAIQGKEAVLSCDYDLEGQQLYAVKWYRGTYEIFRQVKVGEGRGLRMYSSGHLPSFLEQL